MNTNWRNWDYKKYLKEHEEFDYKTWNKILDSAWEERDNNQDPLNGNEFSDWIEELITTRKKAEEACGGSPPFKPNAYYNAEGDILEVYLDDRESYAKWLNPQVSVLLCQETDEVVGFQIWGLSLVKHIEEILKWVTNTATNKETDSSTQES